MSARSPLPFGVPNLGSGRRLGGVLSASLERTRASTVVAAPERDEAAQREASAWERYALDPFALIDDERMTIYSRDFGGRVPFVMFDYQRETLDAWIDRSTLARERRLVFRDMHVEKSRQMGETWAMAYGAWWALVFHYAQGMVMSRKAKDVDDGGRRSTWRSFFGKVRFMQDNAPVWIRNRAPLDYTMGPPAYVRSLTRPDSAFIIGESETADPGRGATFMFTVNDEFARQPWDDQVLQAVRMACPNGKALVSTPRGVSNAFYRIRQRRSSAWRYLRIHWSRHPVYGVGAHVSGEQPDSCAACRLTLEADAAGVDPERVEGAHRYLGRIVSPWYDATVRDMTDEEVAEELDIDYTASLPSRVYREWDEQRHVVHGRVPIDDALPIEIAWDYGLDVTAVLVCQDAPMEYRLIGELEVSDSTPDQVADGVRAVLRELGIPVPMLAAGWTRQFLCVGDPAGEARSLTTNRSVVQDYAGQGFNIVSKPESVMHTIRAVKYLMRGIPKPLVVAGDQCPAFVSHAGANRWPTDVHGKRKPGAMAPLDDEHNHALRAFAYLVARKFPPPRRGDEGINPRAFDAEGAVYTPAVGYDDVL